MTAIIKAPVLPLWNKRSNEYIPVISRIGEKKIYSHSELTWADISANPQALDEVMDGLRDCRMMIEQTHNTAVAALESQRTEYDNKPKLPLLPKTPNLPKRNIKKRVAKKVSTASTIRRSTRSAVLKNEHLIRRSFLCEENSSPIVKKIVEPNMSISNTDLPIQLRLSSIDDSFSDEIKLASVSSFDQNLSEDDAKSTTVDQIISTSPSCVTSTQNSSFSNETRSGEKELESIENNEKSLSPALLTKQRVASKKAEIKSKTKKSVVRRQSKRATRRTRQATHISSEDENDSDVEILHQHDEESHNTNSNQNNTKHVSKLASQKSHPLPELALPEDPLPSNSPLSKDPSSFNPSSPEKSSSIVKLEVVAEEGMDVDEPGDKKIANNLASPPSGGALSVSVLRLTNDDIRRLSSTEITDTQTNKSCTTSPAPAQRVDLVDTNFSLTLSGNSDAEQTPVKSGDVKSLPKSSSRKRKSASVLDGVAAKRRLTRNKVIDRKSHVKTLESKTSEVGESSLWTSTSGSEESRTRRAKPRIAKPVVKNKPLKQKTFLNSAKSKTRHQNSLVMSATPVRTRSKLMTPLFRTPTSSNINPTLKSFLVRNTPEPKNKEAIIEAKKKILEEKQRQGEERQRLLEEKKKKKLAESKKKREERAMRAIRARENREKEEREKRDHMQGKWEQRIADADRTKSQRKLETSAKVNKEMEKIAKAEVKRKEEEEEKLKKFKEQEEEKEKRLLQQQAEKKLAEEQRLKEKYLEEQKRIEEERLREEKFKRNEEERIKKIEAAALKKKQEDEAKKKKLQENLQKMRKKTEMEREAARKLKQEEKRLAKEEEQRKKAQEKRDKEEKLRQEKEEMEAAKERIQKAREAAFERERIQQLEKEKAAKRLEAAKKKEFLRQRLEESRRLQLEKQKQDEEKAKALARQLEYQKKVKEAEERINKLVNNPSHEPPTPNTTCNKTNLNKTYLQGESAANYDMTPRGPAKPLIPSSATNYNLDDFCSDDSTDDEDKPKKIVPKWAKGALFQSAVLHQHSYPPDLDRIFPDLLDPVQLSLIFKKPKTRYFKRTSSAQWNSPIMPPGHISFTEQCKGFE